MIIAECQVHISILPRLDFQKRGLGIQLDSLLENSLVQSGFSEEERKIEFVTAQKKHLTFLTNSSKIHAYSMHAESLTSSESNFLQPISTSKTLHNCNFLWMNTIS